MQWQVDGAPVSGQIVVDRNITVTAVFDYCCPDAPTYQAPADGAGEQALDIGLNWAVSGATSYTVYFGTDSPPPLQETGVTGTSYDPGPLEIGTTYYWAIEAVNDCGSIAGPEWSFTTTTNQPPHITTFHERSYRYNVDATDADDDFTILCHSTIVDSVYFIERRSLAIMAGELLCV